MSITTSLSTMEINFGWILGIIFVSTALPPAVLGHDAVIGHFQMLHEHPELKECAASVVRENEYAGVRITQQEGTCQALPQSWGKDETMEGGYAYAKKVFVKEIFQPPAEVNFEDHSVWKIPGALKTGVKLDVFFSYEIEFISGYDLGLIDHPRELKPGENGQFIMTFYVDEIECYEMNGTDRTGSRRIREWSKWSTKSSSKNMVKMSFLAQTDSVRILANDVELLTYQLKIRNLDTMKQIYVRRMLPEYGQVFIDRIQFTGTIN